MESTSRYGIPDPLLRRIRDDSAWSVGAMLTFALLHPEWTTWPEVLAHAVQQYGCPQEQCHRFVVEALASGLGCVAADLDIDVDGIIVARKVAGISAPEGYDREADPRRASDRARLLRNLRTVCRFKRPGSVVRDLVREVQARVTVPEDRPVVTAVLLQAMDDEGRIDEYDLIAALVEGHGIDLRTWRPFTFTQRIIKGMEGVTVAKKRDEGKKGDESKRAYVMRERDVTLTDEVRELKTNPQRRTLMMDAQLVERLLVERWGVERKLIPGVIMKALGDRVFHDYKVPSVGVSHASYEGFITNLMPRGHRAVWRLERVSFVEVEGPESPAPLTEGEAVLLIEGVFADEKVKVHSMADLALEQLVPLSRPAKEATPIASEESEAPEAEEAAGAAPAEEAVAEEAAVEPEVAADAEEVEVANVAPIPLVPAPPAQPQPVLDEAAAERFAHLVVGKVLAKLSTLEASPPPSSVSEDRVEEIVRRILGEQIQPAPPPPSFTKDDVKGILRELLEEQGPPQIDELTLRRQVDTVAREIMPPIASEELSRRLNFLGSEVEGSLQERKRRLAEAEAVVEEHRQAVARLEERQRIGTIMLEILDERRRA